MARLRPSACAALLLALLAASPAPAGEPSSLLPPGKLSVNAGLDFRTGDYDLERDTHVWFAPFTVKYLFDDFAPTPFRNDQLEIAGTVSYVEIDGPSSVVLADTGVVAIGGRDSLETSRDRGLSDVVARVTYLWFPAVVSPLPAFELTGRAKFPTGDEDRGLGSGAFETTAQLDLYRSFGPVTPIATVGYRFFSGSREFHLRDGALASLGVAARASDWLSGGAFLDWREAASRGTDDLVELLPYLAVKLGRRTTLQPYGVVGFTDGSADWGLGLQVSASFRLGPPR